jgi:hypothetical protein
MNVTIDTNILKKALEDDSLQHISLMFRIRDRKHCITLDFQSLLLNEYNDVLGQYRLFQKWYTELQSNSQIYYCDHKVHQKHETKLLELGFHEPEDMVVLGLAFHADKYLVTEDSDFGKGDARRAQANLKILEYISNDMEVIIHDTQEACKLIT